MPAEIERRGEPHRAPEDQAWRRTGADNRRAMTALLAHAGGKPVG
jgi:hypothetical protein